MSKNTVLCYGQGKEMKRVVLAGTLNEDEVFDIRGALEADNTFIPMQVGLEPCHTAKAKFDVWHRLVVWGIVETPELPSTTLTAREFVDRITSVRWWNVAGWREKLQSLTGASA